MVLFSKWRRALGRFEADNSVGFVAGQRFEVSLQSCNEKLTSDQAGRSH